MDINFGSKKPAGTPPAVQKGSFFGSQNSAKPGIDINDVYERISDFARRMKVIENSLSNLRGSLQNLERNYLTTTKDSRRDIKTLEDENSDLSSEFRHIRETMKRIVEDMKNAAREDEVKIIQKYLDLWNPVNFVTLSQAKKVAMDVFLEMQNPSPPKLDDDEGNSNITG